MARGGAGIGDQGRAKSIVAIRCLLLGESNPTQGKKQAGKSMPIRFLFATLYQKKYIVSLQYPSILWPSYPSIYPSTHQTIRLPIDHPPVRPLIH